VAVLHLQLLGDFQIRTAAGALVPISAKKSQALLAWLGVKPSQRVSRDKVASLLWSSTAPEQARQSLRQTLSSLRRELTQISPGDKILVEEGDLLGLDESKVEADVPILESLVGSGSEEALRRALDMYRGDFLEAFQINEDRFDQWAIAERDRLHRMALRAHQYLLDILIRRGAMDDAIATAQHSIAVDPLQEPVHRTLMRLYLQSGDYVNALQQFETCTKVLKRELGIEPDPETKALHRDIVQRRARAAASAATPAEPQEERRSILIVEDNVLNRELTQALLKNAGYNVVTAKDGAEALMLLGREKVDLLLLDIDLPFIDGHSLLQAAKENGVDIPAIFMSGLPGEQPELRAFEVGASDFIRKPVRNQVLLARVAKVLDGK
jgi:DNA-binding SARP family transcriptional activator